MQSVVWAQSSEPEETAECGFATQSRLGPIGDFFRAPTGRENRGLPLGRREYRRARLMVSICHFSETNAMDSCVLSGHALYSTLAEDPDLAEIVEMFVDEMPERIEQILNCFESEDWTGLQRASHQLKGAAGSYGFPSITPCAGILEAAVRQTRPEEEIRKAVDELVAMCRSVRAGTPA